MVTLTLAVPEELKKKMTAGTKPKELHRPWIDEIEIKCKKCGKKVKRIKDVGDAWLDAGIVPFSTIGPYLTNRNEWKKWFPAEMISENIPGQFRGWFNALFWASVTITGDAPFKSLFGYETLKDEKGEYSLDRLDKQSLGYLQSLDFPIIGPDGKEYKVEHKNPKQKIARWRWSKDSVAERYDELVFKWPYVYTKNYRKDGVVPRSILIDQRFGRTRTGKTELFSFFSKEVFRNPKPSKLIKYLVKLIPNKNIQVLDFILESMADK